MIPRDAHIREAVGDIRPAALTSFTNKNPGLLSSFLLTLFCKGYVGATRLSKIDDQMCAHLEG